MVGWFVLHLCAMAEFIMYAHCHALRLVAAAAGVHCQGLGQTCRSLTIRAKLGATFGRKLVHLNHAYCLARHVFEPSVGHFRADLT